MDVSKNANFIIHTPCDLAEYLLHSGFPTTYMASGMNFDIMQEKYNPLINP